VTQITAAGAQVRLAPGGAAARALTGGRRVRGSGEGGGRQPPSTPDLEGKTMRKWFTALALVSALGFAGPASGMEVTFDDLDANKDGKLSREEASKQAGLDFAKADTNQDGWVTRPEYEAAIG
jgi:hypothetical protein